MKRIILLILGNLWLLPFTIIVTPIILLLVVTGQLNLTGCTRWAVKCRPVTYMWLHKYMERNHWFGAAYGPYIILRWDHYNHSNTVTHEERHVKQQYVFGIFQPILYALSSVFIWLFMWKKHAYYDNPFERDARKAAGQTLDIPKETWKGDRWSWW